MGPSPATNLSSIQFMASTRIAMLIETAWLMSLSSTSSLKKKVLLFGQHNIGLVIDVIDGLRGCTRSDVFLKHYLVFNSSVKFSSWHHSHIFPINIQLTIILHVLRVSSLVLFKQLMSHLKLDFRGQFVFHPCLFRIDRAPFLHREKQHGNIAGVVWKRLIQ